MISLQDVAPELRALIFERLSYQTLITLLKSVPLWRPEIIDCLIELTADNSEQSLGYPILNDLPRLRYVDPIIIPPYGKRVKRVFSRATFNYDHYYLPIDFVNELITPNNHIKVITTRDTSIEWKRGHIINQIGTFEVDLTYFEGCIDHLTIIKSVTSRNLALVLSYSLRQEIPIVEYQVPSEDEVVESSYRTLGDYHMSMAASCSEFLLPSHGWVEQRNLSLIQILVLPLFPEIIEFLIPLCPNLIKIGFQLTNLDRYLNEELRVLLNRYPRLTFVVFPSKPNPDDDYWRDNGEHSAAPWILTHPRVIVARNPN